MSLGTVDRIGGTHGIPVDSMRLRHIRDGQEDRLLMRLAEAKIGRAAVLDIVGAVVRNAYTFSEDVLVFEATRRVLAGVLLNV